VDDDAIREQIARDYERYGDIWCPHTATGFRAYDALPAASKRDAWIVAATAHPAKFDNIVEPVVGVNVDIPPALAALLERPTHAEPIEADLVALGDALAAWR
jgi:threonine synthase